MIPGMFEHPGFQGNTFEGGGHAVPPGFAAFAVIAVMIGIGSMLWRISLARRVAEDAGMDPGQATEMALLGDHGVEAAYLAGHLRQRPVDQQPSTPAARSAEERLLELRSLRDAGLLSQEEYETRRRIVVDSL